MDTKEFQDSTSPSWHETTVMINSTLIESSQAKHSESKNLLFGFFRKNQISTKHLNIENKQIMRIMIKTKGVLGSNHDTKDYTVMENR